LDGLSSFFCCSSGWLWLNLSTDWRLIGVDWVVTAAATVGVSKG
jgi:hypothetical protein